MLDGRVKTLHPAIHGGPARAPRPARAHAARSTQHGIVPIDLVAVNLYPFQMTIAQPGRVVRGRDREHRHRRAVDAPLGGEELRVRAAGRRPDRLSRGARRCSGRARSRRRSGASSPPRSSPTPPTTTRPSPATSRPREDGLPRRLGLAMERMQALRYGENPSQRAALYVTEEPRGIRDLDAAPGQGALLQQPARPRRGDVRRWRAGAPGRRAPSSSTRRPAASRSAAPRSRRSASARATDPVSAFGSVIAFNTVVDRGHRRGDERSLRRGRRGAVVPRRGARGLRRARRHLRVVELPVSRGAGSLDYKRVRGGFLVQDRFQFDPSEQGWTVATDARSRPSASGATCASPGPRWRRSSRTPSCSPGTRRRSASAPAR